MPFANRISFSFLAVALVSTATFLASPPVSAQGAKKLTPELQRTRDALDKYKDPVAAVHDGYLSTVGCVWYPKAGAPGEVPYKAGGMGVHFLNLEHLGKPLDPLKPQILVYEPVGGKLQLVAAEWFVPLSPQVKERPRLFDQPFDGPMEGHHPLMPTGLHHYDLHVWLWKDNPAGLFAPTNPSLKCPKGPYSLAEQAPRIVPHK
jgi:hypothetical protein